MAAGVSESLVRLLVNAGPKGITAIEADRLQRSARESYAAVMQYLAEYLAVYDTFSDRSPTEQLFTCPTDAASFFTRVHTAIIPRGLVYRAHTDGASRLAAAGILGDVNAAIEAKGASDVGVPWTAPAPPPNADNNQTNDPESDHETDRHAACVCRGDDGAAATNLCAIMPCGCVCARETYAVCTPTPKCPACGKTTIGALKLTFPSSD